MNKPISLRTKERIEYAEKTKRFEDLSYYEAVQELEAENKRLREALKHLHDYHRTLTSYQIDIAIKAALEEAK